MMQNNINNTYEIPSSFGILILNAYDTRQKNL